MAHRLLIPQGALLPALQARLEKKYDARILPAAAQDQESFLKAEGEGIEALATNPKFGARAPLLDALPNLKVVSSLGVGLDGLDLELLRKRDIAVGYTPEVLNDCVADIAFALLLDVARGITKADAFVRRGDWYKGGFPMTTRVSGKRLGIIGMGRIGSVIARRALGFDMEVRYHNRRPVEGSQFQYASTPVELAEWADFLVLASAGGAATNKLVSTDVLNALGPKGYLINVSRGSVVDEKVLIEYLRDARIAGAGLDVFEQEPGVSAELASLENVVLTPHVASNTVETRAAMMQRAEDNLDAFFAGKGVVSSAL
ncbi:2-hydroxyacid dehydrogenase [Paraburkholderia sp. Ac-20336]|uniref:2-hydroxyacid dehydrogenase n=1 Tax=Burkholderiaceae TaxID=119060 RepID=UPI00141FD143|nr:MULTISPECIES: 2-hydroxyacid dehydrogenase [Burkholderiaceae]MBN3804764.1 2-hydroxyacid dehydrogenase [Paraburkholderia sp. Ac-20336]MBN3847802.1 2-hydroxyacid dehydrogenase [Paraburkholderia sp. Ac-20342]NIF53271.1 2-hydroxyacid dehydrogenase [Burkholderia sp. Ax-1724]